MGACTSSTQKRKNNVVRQLMPFKVQLTAYIWSRNAHNLFDFESNQCTRKDIEVDFSARLATLENDLLALTKNEWARNQTDIVDLTLEENGTANLSQISPKQDHRIWAIIKNRTGSEFNSLDHWNLKLNDIIKLGRMRLQLLDFAVLKTVPADATTQEQLQGELEPDPASCSADYQGMQDPMMCRVCFSRKATVENPLISPCQCTGSVKYIHVSCLQSWIGVQLKIKKGENFIQYTWKKMSCEICKSTFKNTYMFQGRSYTLINIPKPRSSYLTFKVTSDDKFKEGMIYVVEFQDKMELKIGRIPECDIKLKDISVSRQHAILKLVPTESHTPDNPSYTLRLQDINSKFGTLIMAQSNDLLTLQPTDTPVLYQVGRVLLNFNVMSKTKKTNVSCYKHPEGIPLMNITHQNMNDLATNVNQQQQPDGSFQTHNELNLSDIIIHDQVQVQNPVRLSQSQPLPQIPPRPREPLFMDDLSVCDEHQ